jgi:tetratricopeptide (TPR) repeat protein
MGNNEECGARSNLVEATGLCPMLRWLGYAFCLLAGATLSATGQTSLPKHAASAQTEMQAGTRDELNRGIEAYKVGHYEAAVSRFEKVLQIEPRSMVAEKYLGAALGQMVYPGLDTPGNLQAAARAVDSFLRVLDKYPHDADSMKRIAEIEFSVKSFEEAKEWQKRVLAEEPANAEAAYTGGVVDWTLAHENSMRVLQGAGWQDDGEGNHQAPPAVLSNLKALNVALAEEGLEYLTRAVDNRPDYDEAMVYLNLTYRRKADVDYTDEAAHEEDIAKASEWTQKALEVRRAKEQKKKAEAGPEQP